MTHKFPPLAAVIQAERILNGTRGALLLVAKPKDRYQECPEGLWQRGLLDFEHGKVVHAIQVVSFLYTTGMIGTIISLPTMKKFTAQITGIRMVQIEALTDDEILALGHPSRAEFEQWIGSSQSNQFGWYATIIPIGDTPLQ